LVDDLHSPEFTVPEQKNGFIDRNQPPHISQQSLLFSRRTVPSALPDPSPGNGNREWFALSL
jgi:hypothetical protein